MTTNFKHVWLTRLGGMLPFRCSWCRLTATHMLERISADGGRYSDYVCNAHAQPWEVYAEGTQMELEIQ